MNTIDISKKILQALSVFASIIVLMGVSSCNDILEEDPISLVTADGYYVDAKGIEDGLKASYSQLRQFYGTQFGVYITVGGTDIYTNAFGGSKNGHSYNNYDQNLGSISPAFEALWGSFYQGINQCNTIIGRTPAIADMNDSEKEITLGEARFLRALYYFHLVQQFGDIHFTLDESKGVITEAYKTPISDIYELGIIPDLNYAIQVLPNKQSDYGRVNKSAAEALMARVQLTLGNLPEAIALADNVINNYDYKLIPSLSDLWSIENVVNDEIIFAVQYTYDPLTNAYGNITHKLFNCRYFGYPGLDQSLEYGASWQRLMPTNYFLEIWDEDSDLRLHQSMRTHWIANKAENINGFNVAPGDTALKIVLHEVLDSNKMNFPYSLIDYRGEIVDTQTDNSQIGGLKQRIYPTLRKYEDPLRITATANDGGRDFPVIRLAEMYLIAAECATLLGNKEDAANYINILRERAIAPGKEAEMLVSSDMIDLEFILEERARELCGEMHRWYDLKRTGTLLERVRLYNYSGGPNIKQYHLLRPIPQTQLDRITNPGEFLQNPGY
jgi:hypothetical protein